MIRVTARALHRHWKDSEKR